MNLIIYFTGNSALTINNCKEEVYNYIVSTLKKEKLSSSIIIEDDKTKVKTVINTNNITYMIYQK